MPDFTASSKLTDEADVISVTRATDIAASPALESASPAQGDVRYEDAPPHGARDPSPSPHIVAHLARFPGYFAPQPHYGPDGPATTAPDLGIESSCAVAHPPGNQTGRSNVLLLAAANHGGPRLRAKNRCAMVMLSRKHGSSPEQPAVPFAQRICAMRTF
jgi:hypothetical protein